MDDLIPRGRAAYHDLMAADRCDLGLAACQLLHQVRIRHDYLIAAYHLSAGGDHLRGLSGTGDHYGVFRCLVSRRARCQWHGRAFNTLNGLYNLYLLRRLCRVRCRFNRTGFSRGGVFRGNCFGVSSYSLRLQSRRRRRCIRRDALREMRRASLTYIEHMQLPVRHLD